MCFCLWLGVFGWTRREEAPAGTRRSRSQPPDGTGSRVDIDRFNDPSAGSPTETLLRLLLPLGGRV
jgi:hypothetical protein